MAQKIANSVYRFRDRFRTLHKETLHWFPGHMGKGIKQMQQNLKNVDCVIEVHDARIPLSGRNPSFRYTISGVRPHILVLNKKDLADMSMKVEVLNSLKKSGFDHVIFTNCKDQDCRGLRQIVPTVNRLISSTDRYNRSDAAEFSVMIIGVPNVGKSSLINSLRAKHIGRGKASRVGAEAGVTRSVMNRIRVSENPLVYVLDTPGILTPNVLDTETGLRLALCSCFQDHMVGVDIIADYLLYHFNKNSNFQYVELMGLEEPTDNIAVVLTTGATKLGKFLKLRSVDGSGYLTKPDITFAANYFITAFRRGDLGKVMLDKDLLTSNSVTI